MSKSQGLSHWRQTADQEVYTEITPHIYFHSRIKVSLWKLDLNIRILKWKPFHLCYRRSNKDYYNDPLHL